MDGPIQLGFLKIHNKLLPFSCLGRCSFKYESCTFRFKTLNKGNGTVMI